MICNGCGNQEATRISYSKNSESCDKCGKVGALKFSDVYFKQPYFDPNISDPVKSPFGTHITSRSQKAELMRGLGLHEVGDRRHGARNWKGN